MEGSDAAACSLPAASSGRPEITFARPKSRILTRPSRVTKTFSGLRSRCTIPFSWAAARPLRDLDRVFDGLPRRQRRAGQPLAQRLPVEQLGDRVHHGVLAAEVVEGKDVGVRKG